LNQLHSRLLVILALMVLMAVLSTIPGRAEEGDSVFVWAIAITPPAVHKLGHLGLYAALALLWLRFFEQRGLPAAIIMTLLITIVFGAALEWAQTAIPGRHGTFSDVLLNAAGSILGILAAILLPWPRRARQ
jgi:hypothetical protein